MKMKIKMIVFIICLSLMILIAGCSNGTNNDPGEYDQFAQCLTEKNVVMYGTEWCSHCKNQKVMFGNSFQYVDYIDCDKNKNECVNAGVEGYPTWKINGKNYPGEQSLNKLSSLTGCKL
jgi:glutaredoxin